MESARLRNLRGQKSNEWAYVGKYRKKHFPCGIVHVFIIYILTLHTFSRV